MCILSVLSYSSAGLLGTPYASNGGYADNSPLSLASAHSGIATAPQHAVLSQPILAPAPQHIISAAPQPIYSAPPQEIKIVVQEPKPAPIHVLPAPIHFAPAPAAPAPEIRIVKIIRQLAPPPQQIAPQPQHIKIIKINQQQQQAPARIIRVIEEQGHAAAAPQLIKVIKLHGASHSAAHSHAHSHGPIKIIKIINAGNGGW